MNVHLVYSALPLDERSQCIMKSPGSLPGNARETGLSRTLINYLYMQMTAAPKGQSADTAESFPRFSSFPLCYTRFSKVTWHSFQRELGKTVQEEIVCDFQSCVCPLKLRRGFFWQQKSQTQLQLYCVQNYGLDQDIKSVSQFLCHKQTANSMYPQTAFLCHGAQLLAYSMKKSMRKGHIFNEKSPFPCSRLTFYFALTLCNVCISITLFKQTSPSHFPSIICFEQQRNVDFEYVVTTSHVQEINLYSL